MASLRLYGLSAASFAAGCLAMSAWNSIAPAQSKSAPTLKVAQSPSAGAAPPAQPTQLAAAVSTPVCPPSNPSAPNESGKEPARKLDALLKQVLARPGAAVQDPFSETIDVLKSSARDRADLMARYAKEKDEFARRQLRLLLMSLSNEDVIAFAMNKALDHDPAARSEGFTLLRLNQATSAPAHELLLKAVSTEQDARVLTEVVASLMPGEPSPSPEQAAPVIEQLKRTIQHPSPEVRGESLLALTRWDRSGNTEELIFNGLSDPNPPVQAAALSALFENRVHSARVKTALFELAANSAGPAEARMTAAEALGGFNLTQQEHASLTKLREGIPLPRGEVDNRGN
jgi:HEAT repeats